MRPCTQLLGQRAHLIPVVVCAALFMRMTPAFATDYESVGANPAILFDAPTLRGRKLSVAPRGMPVEIVVVEGDWVRVRDATGELSWIEKKALVDKRVVVATTLASAHAAPNDSSPVVFSLQPGVEADLLEVPADGWVHVRHRDGLSGWIKVTQIWGV